MASRARSQRSSAAVSHRPGPSGCRWGQPRTTRRASGTTPTTSRTSPHHRRAYWDIGATPPPYAGVPKLSAVAVPQPRSRIWSPIAGPPMLTIRDSRDRRAGGRPSGSDTISNANTAAQATTVFPADNQVFPAFRSTAPALGVDWQRGLDQRPGRDAGGPRGVGGPHRPARRGGVAALRPRAADRVQGAGLLARGLRADARRSG